MIMMLIALSTMLLTTACSSEDDALNNTANTENTINKGYALPVTVNVTREDGATRASYNESTRKLEFSGGDKLFVYGSATAAGSFAGELTWQSGGTFSGTIYTQKEWTGTADALFTAASVGENLTATLLPNNYGSTGFLSINNNSTTDIAYDDRLTVSFSNAFVASETAKATGVEQLSWEQAINNYSSVFALSPGNAILNFTITGLEAGAKDVSLQIDNGIAYTVTGSVTPNASGVATFAIGVPVGANIEDMDNNLTVGTHNLTLPSSTTFAAGKIYNITRCVNAINGKFSVSSTKKVFFSKGNLQYDGTNWKFAASQWEVLGANGTGANGAANSYPMDLFTWGNIDSPTYNGTTYYTEDADLSGITDWGSRMGSGWYTLSKDECLYLFGMESNNTDKRGHARYCKYFRAKVNGVSGIVVLPDDLSGISDIPAESSRGTASTFNGKTYTTDAWSAMESAGCVFLPAAGFRNGNSVMNVGSSGFYWPSTANGSGSAFTVGFDKDNVFPANNFNRNIGFSVRLVCEVPSN